MAYYMMRMLGRFLMLANSCIRFVTLTNTVILMSELHPFQKSLSDISYCLHSNGNVKW